MSSCRASYQPFRDDSIRISDRTVTTCDTSCVACMYEHASLIIAAGFAGIAAWCLQVCTYTCNSSPSLALGPSNGVAVTTTCVNGAWSTPNGGCIRGKNYYMFFGGV